MHNYILPAITLVVIIMFGIFWLLDKTPSYKRATKTFNSDNAEGLKPYWERRNSWMLALLWWSYFSYYITGMGFLASMEVLYLSARNVGTQTEYIAYSIVTAICTIINFAVKPQKKSRGYRDAWKRLDHEIFLFMNIHCSGGCHLIKDHDTDCFLGLATAVQKGEEDIRLAEE